LFERTDVEVTDVDVAGLYDGFSPLVLNWIEALGFCGRGEAAGFVERGETWLGGLVPVNTDGGAANMGRIHGINFIAEMLWQLRGSCGSRQVAGAEVAVATGAAGPYAGCMLLTVDR
jgi:acetyl-CoA acetyltransferase